MRLAAIDVGTNSILLTIAEPDGKGGWRVLDDRCRVERLGQGVDRNGALHPDAIARGLDALDEYARAITDMAVDRVAVVGTQALREAANGQVFTDGARALLGVPLEIIAGRREAELSFAAVSDAFPQLSGALVVLDVGGGSTELIVGERGRIERLTSLPIGSVRLFERYLASDPPTPEQARALAADVDHELASFALPSGSCLVGVAGTATTLASIALALERYDATRVQGARVTLAEIEAIGRRLYAAPLAERRRIVGLDPKRAEVIPAGCSIIARVLHHAQASELVVSDRGLRFGLLAELARAA